MKENLKKTSLLYRIIAVVLTFIMVGTTLYFHFEKRYDAKAFQDDVVTILPVYLPGENTSEIDEKINYTGESGNGWLDVDTSKPMNTSEAGRRYGIIVKAISGNTISNVNLSKNGNFDDKISFEPKNLSDDTGAFFFEVPFADLTNVGNWKIVLDYNNGTNNYTEYKPEVTLSFGSSIVTSSVETNITVLKDDMPFDFAGQTLYAKDGEEWEIIVTSGSPMTALTVLDKSFDETQINDDDIVNCDLDRQTCTYTYNYKYNFDNNNTNGVEKSSNNYASKKIIVTVGGTNKEVECTSLLYDCNDPTITENPDSGWITDKDNIYKTYIYKYKLSDGEGVKSGIDLDASGYKINDSETLTLFTNEEGQITVANSQNNLGTTLHFYIVDNAGNVTEESETICVDGNPPTDLSMIINGEQNLLSLGDTWFKPDADVLITANDAIELKKISVKEGGTELFGENINATSASINKKIYEIVNKNIEDADGEYTITLYAYDKAISQTDPTDTEGNITQISGTLKIDGHKPKIVEGDSVKLVYLNTDNGTYPEVDAAEISDGIYNVNKDYPKTIYYRVKLEDIGGSGIASAKLMRGDDEVGSLNEGPIFGYYSVAIPYSSQNLNEVVDYKIKVTDNAGNETELGGLTKICVINSEIRFTNVKLEDENGNIIINNGNISDLNSDSVALYSNKQYKLTFTTSSGSPITEVGIKDNSGYLDSKTYTGLVVNPVTKLYSVESTFYIPKEKLNTLFNDLKVYANDELAAHPTKEQSIRLLMYDSTLPIVRGADVNSEITTDNEWHKSYPFSFTIWSGKENTESPLTAAGYTITGTDAGVDVTSKNYALNGTETYKSDLIDIPESNNVGGTTITFSATDSATNSMIPISFTFKVDATNPVIDSLTAAGNEENTIPLAGDPSIAAGFSDNLTLGKATFTVSLPDGTTKTFDIADADSEEKNISMSKSYKISEIIGSEPADGNYKVKLSVEDKAGNSAAEKEIRFAIDNTPPMFTADIVSGSSVKNNSYYNTAVTVRLTVDDNNFDSGKISITDNGQAVSLDNSWQIEDGIRVGTITIPETSEGGHDIRIGGVDTAGLSGATKNVSFIIDKTVPGLELTLNDEAYNEGMGTRYMSGSVKVNAIVTDVNEDVPDLRMQIIKTVPGQEASISNYDPTSEREFTFTDEAEYTLNYMAVDKANNASLIRTVKFDIDNTAPVLNAEIISGASGKENGYYNSDVVIRFTCVDNNFNVDGMSVTDNSTPVNAEWKNENGIWYTDITVTSEGIHNMYVNGFDKAGTTALPRQGVFVIDKTVPTVALLMNGTSIYNESMGTLNLTGPLTLGVSVTDTNEDTADLRVQVIKTVPDTETQTSEFVSTGERTFTFSDEADYTVNIFAVDLANNQGSTRTISFRVDKAAPEISITGAGGGTSASASTVTFSINEAFWMDAKGTVTIKRKAGDGVEEEVYKTINVTPTSRLYSISEVISETGVYKFEFEASDRVGHTATASQTLTVDRNKPEIKLTGVKNYDVTDGEVSISAVITDEFYSNKTVSISGTRTGIDGKKTQISFSPFAAAANPTSINDTFTEDGIYDIIIVSRDIAGNESSSSVHFTIDKTAPVIGDLSMYDGKSFREIDLDEIDLDNLVTDLTVCEVRMYLNGSEYDGLAEIEDGSYTLLITAVDELGHTSEKSVTFVLDTKAPVFIVTGVEDGEIKDNNYNIEVSLQLDEDTLDKVSLNGKDVVIKNNVATVNVTERGKYELYMKAYDEAGNEDENTISFVYGDESVAASVTDDVKNKTGHWWLWLVVAAGILAAGGGILFAIKRRERE